MTNVTTRAAVGRPLTFNEMDSNFTQLDSNKAENSKVDQLSQVVAAASANATAAAQAVQALAQASGSSLVGFVQSGASSATRLAQDKLRESVSVKDFGAKGDGVTDDTASIQAAINAAYEVRFIPGETYIVSPDMTRTNQDGAVGICIDVHSNLRLVMYGATIKQKSGTSGASIIGNSQIVSNVLIEGGVVDGNRANTVANNTCAVVLFHATDCTIRNVTTKDVQLIGVGFRNINTGYGRNRVENCNVYGSNYIGIQVRYQELGCAIQNNIVEGTTDNAIDIEGSGGTQGIGNRLLITGNRCYSCRQGIFLESVGEAIVSNNFVQNYSLSACTLNTITANTGIRHVIVANNEFRDGSGQIGLWIRNTSSRIQVYGNLFSVMKYGIEITGAGGGSGGGSYVSIGLNQYEGITSALVHAPQETNALVWSRIQKQDYMGTRNVTTGRPFTISPLSNGSNYSNRSYRVDIVPAFFMGDGASAADLESEYKDGVTVTLSQNSAWSNAYAVYQNTYNANYETLIYVGSGTLNVGRYVKINGLLFKVSASRATGVYAIQGAGGNDGNFTSQANGAYAGVEYYSDWQEA